MFASHRSCLQRTASVHAKSHFLSYEGRHRPATAIPRTPDQTEVLVCVDVLLILLACLLDCFTVCFSPIALGRVTFGSRQTSLVIPLRTSSPPGCKNVDTTDVQPDGHRRSLVNLLYGRPHLHIDEGGMRPGFSRAERLSWQAQLWQRGRSACDSEKKQLSDQDRPEAGARVEVCKAAGPDGIWVIMGLYEQGGSGMSRKGGGGGGLGTREGELHDLLLCWSRMAWMLMITVCRVCVCVGGGGGVVESSWSFLNRLEFVGERKKQRWKEGGGGGGGVTSDVVVVA